jgi:ELWxxDGT repeat protein
VGDGWHRRGHLHDPRHLPGNLQCPAHIPNNIVGLGNGKALFDATNGIGFHTVDAGYGAELWVTNGTPGTRASSYRTTASNNSHTYYSNGTSIVKDANPQNLGSYPGDITALGNGKALFSATDGTGTHGYELWVSDGTYAGTSQVKDINPGSGGSGVHAITALGNGKALFSATDGTHGYELWVSDGTAAGTSLVQDINPGSGSSGIQDVTKFGTGKALFSANDGTHGYELWVSDGTTASLVQDINPGSSASNPKYITDLGTGKAVFSANDGTHGTELWVTNGTAAGTLLVKDIFPGISSHSSNPTDITALGNGRALFSANDRTSGIFHGYELWVTNGTAAGTYMLKDINPGTGSSHPKNITALGNGKALFSANDGTHGYELWVTDGTASGTYLVKDINSGSGNSNPRYITSLGNGSALFDASDGTHGYQLWMTDGTAAGTSVIVPSTGPSLLAPRNFVVLCFAPGTRIRTPAGEVAVETLRRGDFVVVTDGRTVPITWIGRQTVSTRFGDPLRVLPIRIRAGALADNVPCRDLLLTPDHAILVDDVLVQAGALVNGTSIVRERNVPERLTYYHVELDDHSLLLAENTPAETFVDNIDRLPFDNWAEHEALYPHGKLIVEMPHPRAKAHRQVPKAIKHQLNARAAEFYEAVAAVA